MWGTQNGKIKHGLKRKSSNENWTYIWHRDYQCLCFRLLLHTWCWVMSIKKQFIWLLILVGGKSKQHGVWQGPRVYHNMADGSIWQDSVFVCVCVCVCVCLCVCVCKGQRERERERESKITWRKEEKDQRGTRITLITIYCQSINPLPESSLNSFWR
jgi:hypothetical protein